MKFTKLAALAWLRWSTGLLVMAPYWLKPLADRLLSCRTLSAEETVPSVQRLLFAVKSVR